VNPSKCSIDITRSFRVELGSSSEAAVKSHSIGCRHRTVDVRANGQNWLRGFRRVPFVKGVGTLVMALIAPESNVNTCLEDTGVERELVVWIASKRRCLQPSSPPQFPPVGATSKVGKTEQRNLALGCRKSYLGNAECVW
jgi:hypothetical protein